MSLEEVYSVERVKWDALAQQKLAAVEKVRPGDDFYEYTRRVSTMVGIADFFGDLSGKSVLEYGCGLGEVAVLLAKTGARVVTFDLSPLSVAVTRRRAALNNVADRVDVVVAAGENLPYTDESFDAIFGKAILHHVDMNEGWYDIYRVLKTGGKAAFIEPMGMNPILKFVRNYIPYPEKNPRGADRPLNYNEIRGWGQKYRKFYFKEVQLFSMLERGLGFNKRIEILRRLDRATLEKLPFLRRYCRYVNMFMVK